MNTENSAKSDKKKSKDNGFSAFRSWGRVFAIIIVGIVCFLLISCVVMVASTRSDKDIVVPDLHGESFVSNYNRLTRMGLEPVLKFREVYDIDDGIILSQHPAAGVVVDSGDKIKLVISKSEFKVEVPNITDLNLSLGLNKLSNINADGHSVALQAGVVSYVQSDKAENLILQQSPAAGEKVDPDTKINLLVSCGKDALNSKMPNVINQNIDLAYKMLESKGFNVYEKVIIVGSKKKSGKIIGQKPYAGARLKDGNKIFLKVGYYPKKEKEYYGYEKIKFTIDDDGGAGLYEAYVEDFSAKTVCYSCQHKAGDVVEFVYKREGDAKVTIYCNKKKVEVYSAKVERF